MWGGREGRREGTHAEERLVEVDDFGLERLLRDLRQGRRLHCLVQSRPGLAGLSRSVLALRHWRPDMCAKIPKCLGPFVTVRLLQRAMSAFVDCPIWHCLYMSSAYDRR